MKNKLLILSRNVPPRFSGTSVVVENLLKGFKDENIVVVGEKFISGNYNHSKIQYNNLHYITVLFNTNTVLTKLLRKLQILSGFVLLVFIVLKYRPNKVLVIYPSAEYLFMGLLLSKIYKVNYYSYFHNTYKENRVGTAKFFASCLQERVFKYSEIVFLISDGLKNYYKDNYLKHTSKFETLTHSFIEDISSEINVNIYGKTKIAFSGSINASCKDAINRLLKALSTFNNVEFNFFGNHEEAFFLSLGLRKDSFTIYSNLDRNQFITELKKCDVMLLAHGFGGDLSDIEYKTIFPTKTIEYLFSGKPIFYHGPADSYLTNFLSENKCAIIVDVKSEKEIKSSFKKLIENQDLRKKIVKNALQVSKSFHISKIIKKLRNQIHI